MENVVPLVYNLNFGAVAALVMGEYHRTLHTFIDYFNNSPTEALPHSQQPFKFSTGCEGVLLALPAVRL